MAFDSISPILPDSAISATSSAPEHQLGAEVIKNGIKYMYVYNVGNSQISKGQYGRIPADDLDAVYSVTVSNTVSQVGEMMIVGVAHNATIATGYYGWLATRGMVYIALDSGEVSFASGELLAAGLNGGFVAAPVTFSTGARIGFTVNSCVTAVGTGKAVFRSPLFG